VPIDSAAVWARSQKSWGLEGPSSGGGRSIVFTGDRVYVVSYGDAAIGYGEVAEYTVAGFCTAYAAHPAAHPAIEWLRSRDAVSQPRAEPPIAPVLSPPPVAAVAPMPAAAVELPAVVVDLPPLTVIVAPPSGGVVHAHRLHRGPIHSVDVSADGHRIATGGEDGWLHLLDGPRLVASTGPAAPVRAIVFAGDRLIASRGERTLEVFDARDLSPTGVLVMTAPAHELRRWGDDVIVAGADGALSIISLTGGPTRRLELGLHDPTRGLARFGAHGIGVATGSELILADIETGAMTRHTLDHVAGRSLHDAAIRALRPHPDGRRLVVDYTHIEMDLYIADALAVVDPGPELVVEQIQATYPGGTCVLLEDGILVLGLRTDTIRTLPACGSPITAFASGPSSSSQMVVGDASGMLRIWDLGALADDESLALAREAPSGAVVTVHDRPLRIQRRDLERGHAHAPLPLPYVARPAVTALVDDRIAIEGRPQSAGVSSTFLVLDATGTTVLDARDQLSLVRATTVARGGRLAAMVGDVRTGTVDRPQTTGWLLVVDVATGHTVARVEHGFWYAERVLLSPDGARAVVDDLTRYAFVRVNAGQVVSRPKAELAGWPVGFAHPGGWLTIGAQLVVLDPDRGDPIATHGLPAGVPPRDTVFDLDDGGRRIALAGIDGMVHLVDLLAGATTALPRSSSSTVSALAFAPDGAQLAIGHADGTLAVVAVERRELVAMHAGGERVIAVTMPRGDRIACIDVRGRLALYGIV